MMLARIVSWSSFDISCKAGAKLSFWHDLVARHRAEERPAPKVVHKMVEPCCRVGGSQLEIFGVVLHADGQTVILAHLLSQTRGRSAGCKATR